MTSGRTRSHDSEPTSRCPLIVARRWDQLGGRLSAIVNARSIAEWLGLEFRFVWPRGLDVELNDPEQIFSPAFLDAFEIRPSELDGRPLVNHWEIVGGTDSNARRALTTVGVDVFVEVHEIFDVVRCAAESISAARDRFRRCFSEIDWSDDARRLTDFCSGWSPGGIAAIHVRAGDIVGGAWRQVVNHEKYLPTPFVHAAIERFAEGGTKQVLVLSDNAQYLAWLRDRFPTIVTAAEIVPDYASLTATQQALAEILMLSRCEPIVGPPSSAFSRLAANLGTGSLVRGDCLVAQGQERKVLQSGIAEQRSRAVASNFWGALTARDICWCLDVFNDTLSLAEQAELAHWAIELDPGFSGGLARFARVATLLDDWRSARDASAQAIRIAESAERHDDPLMESLATDVARGCFAAVRRPLRHQGDRRLPPLWWRKCGGRGEWRDAEMLREAIKRSFDRCLELEPIWFARHEVLDSLRSLIAMAEQLSDETPAVRRRGARSLAAAAYDDVDIRSVRADGLEQHRVQPMFDPLTRDLDRMALHLYDAVHRAGVPVDAPRLALASIPARGPSDS